MKRTSFLILVIVTSFCLGFAFKKIIPKQAKKAGAKITRPAQKTFWGGYSGYFQDPDEHLWEIAYNPNLIPQN